jgi:uncharacterized membrane protein YraQ (UPF0718 family)
MIDQLSEITEFVINAFLHVWPYLLVTIPLAVAARMSGASKYINRVFRARPLIAIILATLVGAFSPFCSCTVIPIINGLLISGVPLAPVMSFWIASPSMDPEIFFLSVATIGWELAVWRLVSTLILSLAAGFLTHYVEKKKLLGTDILRIQGPSSSVSVGTRLKEGWLALKSRLINSYQSSFRVVATPPSPVAVCCGGGAGRHPQGISEGSLPNMHVVSASECEGGSKETDGGTCSEPATPFLNRLSKEIWDATTMVLKFMILAFALEALIELYIPPEWISGLLGGENPWAILVAAFLGVPAYTSSLAALPMVGGLLSQGMNPAAGLAFLIAGPTTTLPAMAAVWGIVSRRVFSLYIATSLVGAILLGYAFNLFG